MTEAAGPLEAVEGQLAAYNARDIEAFAAWFAEDVELFRLGDCHERPRMAGRELAAPHHVKHTLGQRQEP